MIFSTQEGGSAMLPFMCSGNLRVVFVNLLYNIVSGWFVSTSISPLVRIMRIACVRSIRVA